MKYIEVHPQSSKKIYNILFKYWRAEKDGVTYYRRSTRWYWKPIETVGKLISYINDRIKGHQNTELYWRIHWWVRKNILHS